MTAIRKAVADVYFNIPADILRLGFEGSGLDNVISLDEAIINRVIRPRVMVDCNIVGGVSLTIPVGSCILHERFVSNMVETVIDVPKTLTNNRSIIAPVGIFQAYLRHTVHVSDPLSNALNQMTNNMDPPQIVSVAKLEMIGENKVLAVAQQNMLYNTLLKCNVENDNNLANIATRSHLAFSELVLLAVKAYIYVNLQVKLGQGYIYNGHELGVVTDVLSDFSSANDDYKEYLRETWSKVAFCNDKVKMVNFLRSFV